MKTKFIEEQKTALAKGERMKSANALGQNLRAASVPRLQYFIVLFICAGTQCLVYHGLVLADK